MLGHDYGQMCQERMCIYHMWCRCERATSEMDFGGVRESYATYKRWAAMSSNARGEGRKGLMACNRGGGDGYTFVPNTCVLVAPTASSSAFKQTRGTRRSRCAAAAATAAAGKAWCWLLLALLMVSGPPLLCTCAAAAAGKTYYSGEELKV